VTLGYTHEGMSTKTPSRPPDGNLPINLPPHANAKVHKQVMHHLATMTREEFLATLVRAGICTPDGKLTEHYAGTAEEDTANAAE
jgi:hypothetical protein